MARKGVTFKDRDKGWQRIVAEIGKARGNPRVKVGVLASSGAHEGSEGVSVADVATFHEFGTSRVPERSFLRATVDIKRVEINARIESLWTQIVTGAAEVRPSLALLGVMLQGWIRERISEGIPPALSESTRRQKNKGAIGKATQRIVSLTKRGDLAGYRHAQKQSGQTGPLNTGSFGGRLSDKDRGSLNRAAEVVITGGKSTALIDTGQLRNSINFEVEDK